MNHRHLLTILCLSLAGLLFASKISAQTVAPTPIDRAATLVQAANAFDAGVQSLDTDRAAAERSLRAAIAGYQKIIDSGIENGKLYYNIGNAQLLLNDTGHAIASYRRAQRLIPSDPNLQANLADALSRVSASFAAPPERAAVSRFRSILRQIPIRPLVWVGAIAWAGLWLSLLVRLGAPKLSRTPAIVLTVVFAGASTVVALNRWQDQSERRGVVVAAQTVGRKGPDQTAYAPSFAEPLPAGVEFDVVDTRPGWTLIHLADDRETWIPRTDLALIKSGDRAKDSASNN